jgi:hypothetical protein
LENIIEKNSVEVFKGRFEKAEANLKIEHYWICITKRKMTKRAELQRPVEQH